jgi:uridine phosphorylase
MNLRFAALAVLLSAAVASLPPLLLSTQRAEAQGVSNSLISGYLTRMGVTWKPHSEDANAFVVTKTTGLKRATRVEMVITNLAKDDLVTLRAFPQRNGKYLSLGAARNQGGLTKTMLQRNATAFGAYFVDSDGDIGFRYVFTTESGLGYASFRVAVNELLRIADDVVVGLYNQYR